jgi:hypothetical protein
VAKPDGKRAPVGVPGRRAGGGRPASRPSDSKPAQQAEAGVTGNGDRDGGQSSLIAIRDEPSYPFLKKTDFMRSGRLLHSLAVTALALSIVVEMQPGRRLGRRSCASVSRREYQNQWLVD